MDENMEKKDILCEGQNEKLKEQNKELNEEKNSNFTLNKNLTHIKQAPERQDIVPGLFAVQLCGVFVLNRRSGFDEVEESVLEGPVSQL